MDLGPLEREETSCGWATGQGRVGEENSTNKMCMKIRMTMKSMPCKLLIKKEKKSLKNKD